MRSQKGLTPSIHTGILQYPGRRRRYAAPPGYTLPPKFQGSTQPETKALVAGILPLGNDLYPEEGQHLRNQPIQPVTYLRIVLRSRGAEVMHEDVFLQTNQPGQRYLG